MQPLALLQVKRGLRTGDGANVHRLAYAQRCIRGVLCATACFEVAPIGLRRS